MKRFAQLFIITIVAISGMLWLNTAPALAANTQSQKQATECLQKYGYDYIKKHGGNPVTYADGSKEIAKKQNDNSKPYCFSMNKAPYGNCFFAMGETGRYFITKCDTEPGSNKARHDKAAQESEDAQNAHDNSGGNVEGYTDEAVDKALCTAKTCDIVDNFINPAIRVLSVLVGLAAAVGIIFGAIQVSMSGGDPQKAANGKNHIRNAIIAIVTYVLLFIVLNWLIPGGIM